MLTIHTSTFCSTSSGPGGYAAIIEMDGQEMVMLTGGDPRTDSDRMGLHAVIEAFQALGESRDMSRRTVTVRTNTRLVADAFNQKLVRDWQANGWRTQQGSDVAHWELWDQLLRAINNYVVTWQWLPDRNSDVWSKRCDLLANSEAGYALQVGEYWSNKGTPRSIQARRQARK